MKRFLIICIFLVNNLSADGLKGHANVRIVNSAATACDVEWAIIGAGPAGICTVGVLLDLGVDPRKIAWIDPEFSVGRLSLYQNVSANNKARIFVKFINACKTFCECDSPAINALKEFDSEEFAPLSLIVKPLQDIVSMIRKRVVTYQECLQAMDFVNDVWQLQLTTGSLTAQRVVLATGSHPKQLDYPVSHQLPLDKALDKEWLGQHVEKDDTIAVVGGMHSALLIMKYLHELGVARIFNLYKEPFQYAIDTATWELNGMDGLNGVTAHFAYHVLEKNPPANIIRLLNSEEARKAWLPVCSKIVYAIGYERSDLPVINGNAQGVSYDSSSGYIAPRLFGIGIAFPEKFVGDDGYVEYKIGLMDFLKWAQFSVPQWAERRSENISELFDQLCSITVL